MGIRVFNPQYMEMWRTFEIPVVFLKIHNVFHEDPMTAPIVHGYTGFHFQPSQNFSLNAMKSQLHYQSPLNRHPRTKIPDYITKNPNGLFLNNESGLYKSNCVTIHHSTNMLG